MAEAETKTTPVEPAPTSESRSPVTRMTVDDRPKKQEDPSEIEERCKRALERSGRDPSVYQHLSPQDREELASLDKAYPEGAMFEKAAEYAFQQMRDRKAQQAS